MRGPYKSGSSKTEKTTIRTAIESSFSSAVLRE